MGIRLVRRPLASGYEEPLDFFNKRKYCSVNCANKAIAKEKMKLPPSTVKNGRTTCKEYGAGCPMRYLWEIRADVGSPQGRESIKQLYRELNKIVHELSQEAAPTKTFLRCMWAASQGSRIMFDAFTTTTESGETREGTTTSVEGSTNQAITVDFGRTADRITVNPKVSVTFAKVVYGICSDGSNSMKSSNPNSGIYKADTTRTLDLNGGNPSCNQGGMAVVQKTYGADLSQKAEGICFKEEIATCVNTGTHGGHGNHVINTTAKAFPSQAYDSYQEGLPFTTLKAQGGTNGGGSESLVANLNIGINHIVRRLTPLECERLQNFPDYWAHIKEIQNPTESDIEFWTEVWETHRKITGPNKKPKSRNQIIKWLKNPYSDSASYKALGNSVAVCCPEYVLEGIAEVLRR